MPSSLISGGFQTSPRDIASGTANGGLVQFPIANNYGSNLFVGDPVKLATDGTLNRVTTSTDKVLGVFCGLNAEGQSSLLIKKYFEASASARSGAQLTGLVQCDPNAVFEVQADGSVTAGDVGANFMVTVGTGNTSFGISTARIESSTRSDSAGMVKVLGLSPRADNSWTDAYPMVLVMFNRGVHQLTTPSVA